MNCESSIHGFISIKKRCRSTHTDVEKCLRCRFKEKKQIAEKYIQYEPSVGGKSICTYISIVMNISGKLYKKEVNIGYL